MKKNKPEVENTKVLKEIAIFFLLAFGIFLVVFFLFNFPLLKNNLLRGHRLVRRHLPVARNLAVTYFKIPQRQSSKTILNYPLQGSGCGAVLSVDAGNTTNMGIQSGGIPRTYLLYLPPKYSNSVPHALVLSFHGYASSDIAEERMTDFNRIADANNVIMVYPQGTTGLLAARGWNTGLHPTLNANDVLFVSNMLNQLQSNLCIDPNRIYATGFSNGGGFVGKLMCTLSDRIAAFAPISGSYVTPFSECKTLRPISVLEIHGTADRIVPYDGIPLLKEFSTQAWLGKWAKKDGCLQNPTVTQDSVNVTRYEWTGCMDNAEVIHYRIYKERHVWPRPIFPTFIGGQKKYVNAADLIWDFFSKHPLMAATKI